MPKTHKIPLGAVVVMDGDTLAHSDCPASDGGPHDDLRILPDEIKGLDGEPWLTTSCGCAVKVALDPLAHLLNEAAEVTLKLSENPSPGEVQSLNQRLVIAMAPVVMRREAGRPADVRGKPCKLPRGV